LERHVQQHIGKLIPDRVGRATAQGVIQLEGLFDEIGAQRLAGLGPVPGASGPEVADQVHGASKR
jgi:hypothetical protein